MGCEIPSEGNENISIARFLLFESFPEHSNSRASSHYSKEALSQILVCSCSAARSFRSFIRPLFILITPSVGCFSGFRHRALISEAKNPPCYSVQNTGGIENSEAKRQLAFAELPGALDVAVWFDKSWNEA